MWMRILKIISEKKITTKSYVFTYNKFVWWNPLSHVYIGLTSIIIWFIDGSFPIRSINDYKRLFQWNRISKKRLWKDLKK